MVERREDMREIRMRCQASGAYAHWLLTEALGRAALNPATEVAGRG